MNADIARHAPEYHRVYVWEIAVRAFHWINVLCVLLLAATGFLIANPQTIFYASEAYQQYWFGWVRFTHFASAYVFFFNFLFRVYWSFVGNRFSRWDRYVPYKKEHFLNLWEVLTTDILQIRLRGSVRVGHNYLAGATYFVLFLIFVFQAITGFALYADMSSFFLPQLFTWVTPLFGGDAWVRQWHHILMWFFIVFTIFHVYLVIYHDVFEGRGTTSSMIGGWKFDKNDEIRK